MSFGLSFACSNACFAATLVAFSSVRLLRSASARVSLACALAIISMGFSQIFLALDVSHNMATAAPSLIGEQSKSFKGDEMIGEFIAVSSVILFWYCAYGFFDPFSWFFTAHNAICSSVVPYSFMCRLAISA